jgi:hypothetical protein
LEPKEAKAVAAATAALEAKGDPVSCRICDDDFPVAGISIAPMCLPVVAIHSIQSTSQQLVDMTNE